MALDRFVYFASGRRPAAGAVLLALEDYVRDLGTVTVQSAGPRAVVSLPGSCSTVLRRQAGVTPASRQRFDGEPEPRFFEVYIGDDYVDVITRQQDEVTNAIAKGFARWLLGFWQGEDRDGWSRPVAPPAKATRRRRRAASKKRGG